MKFIIGTRNEKKVKSVREMVAQVSNLENFTVKGFDAASEVPETPWDRQTFEGARNRAQNCKESNDGDYFIGLESGLIERYGHIFEEAWCCVLSSTGEEYFGYSSGLKVPDYIIQKMDELKIDHNSVMKLIEDEVEGLYKDTWANYSGKSISRTVSLDEALRNALIQTFASEKSYYKR